MLANREGLERRRRFLTAAISYVEEQRVERGRATEDFLAWCKHELSLVEILLQENRLLDQMLSLGLAPPKVGADKTALTP